LQQLLDLLGSAECLYVAIRGRVRKGFIGLESVLISWRATRERRRNPSIPRRAAIEASQG